MAKVPIDAILLTAVPLIRDLTVLIIHAVQANQADDVTPEQIDGMLVVVEEKNNEIKQLIKDIRDQQTAATSTVTDGAQDEA